MKEEGGGVASRDEYAAMLALEQAKTAPGKFSFPDICETLHLHLPIKFTPAISGRRDHFPAPTAVEDL